MLRPYQEVLVARVVASLSKNPIAVLPTGGGKTRCAVEMQQRIGGAALFVAHRRELIGQAHAAFLRAGAHSGVVMAGHHADSRAPIQIASVQTLARRETPPADVVFIDEAHHATKEGQYARLFALGVPVVGLTATPFRLDGKGLGQVGFGEIVVGATVPDLIREGFLVEPAVFAPAPPDLSSVHVVAGDYQQDELGAAMSTGKIVGRLVETWQQHGVGRRTVCFAVNVAHSLTIRDRFRAAGVRAEHLDGTTPKDERARVLALLAAHQIDVLTNCNIVTEGWDLPALEVAVVARPTKSLCLHLQIIGRIMRANEGKSTCTVLDHAGNYHAHGLVTDPLTYDLHGKVKKGAGLAPTKACPECGAVVPAGLIECACGHVFERPETPLEGDGMLVAVSGAGAPARAVVTFADKEREWAKCWAIAVSKQRHDIGGMGHVARGVFESDKRCVWAAPMANAMFFKRFNEWPIHVGARLVNPETMDESEWPALREAWRESARARGWENGKVMWFVRKCETDLRAKMRSAVSA